MNTNDKQLVLEHLTHVRHWLPQQGPIQVFIHHNTLHALEEMSFESAVEYASTVRKTRPYLSHQAYFDLRSKGRIDDQALGTVLNCVIGKLPGGNCTVASGNADRNIDRVQLWKALVEIPELEAPDETVLWLWRDQFSGAAATELWKFIENQPLPAKTEKSKAKVETYSQVDERMVTLASAYLDQGMSYWPMPHRENGFLSSFLKLYPNKAPTTATDALDVILYFLKKRGIEKSRWESFLLDEALALPGWAGTFSVLESKPLLLPEKGPVTSLADFLAVRLCLSDAYECKSTDEVENQSVGHLARAYTLFRLCRALELEVSTLEKWTKPQWISFVSEVESFGDLARRRLLHQAYEAQFTRMFLGSVISNAKINRTVQVPAVKFQAIFCIDEREESLRRHVEEVCPEFETLAVAGFFGVDMWYQGLGEHHPAALCPVVITPKHLVRESAVKSQDEIGRGRLRRQRTLELVMTTLHDSSRNLAHGWWMTAFTGLAAAVPLFTRVLFPRWSARVNKYLLSFWFPSVETNLIFEREDGEPKSSPSKLLAGYNLEEMTVRVEGVLRAIGITKHFTPLVFILGHGSNSLNNPHESAHDCGACGGGRGGPNARVFALMANHPLVRKKLAERGLLIPDSTHFVGGFHNTCSDAVVFFDKTKIPLTLQTDFKEAQTVFDKARMFDAHERCRRFDDVRHLTPARALLHVEGRCQDLRQPRPEYGHATNALCIVGRREISRQLYLDRRSFLSSYDNSTDPEGKILAGILGAVIPVCAGISLEYYFSFVDNEGYGCGTKLPHNITSLVGVMNGFSSDLRTGLPWQMVEIHEPVRLLFLIETERWKMEKIIQDNPTVAKLVKNAWVQLAVLEPGAEQAQIYRDGVFVPYLENIDALEKYPSSRSYYDGKAQHLWPVRIENDGGLV